MPSRGPLGWGAVVLLGVSLALWPPGVQAGIITGGGAITGAPSNDDFTGPGNPNLIELVGVVDGFGPADLEFTVAGSAGTTEYLVSILGLDNGTGVTWRGFRFELGFGVGAGFVEAPGATGLSFDSPSPDPPPTGGVFSVLDQQAASLTWSGGQVPPVFSNAFSFSIDVPNLSEGIPPFALGGDGGYRFTLRAFPVPAPAPLLLVGLGLVGWSGLAWRSRRQGRARGSGSAGRS